MKRRTLIIAGTVCAAAFLVGDTIPVFIHPIGAVTILVDKITHCIVGIWVLFGIKIVAVTIVYGESITIYIIG